MEDSSHELIEQLIAEEKYCYGFETNLSINNLGVMSASQEPPFPYPSSTNSLEQKTNNNKDISLTFINENSTTTIIGENATLLCESKKVLISKESSSTIPSHNKRWTEEEDKLLNDAVEMFGYGQWKAVSDHVKTRNTIQCKNRARQNHSHVSQQKKIEAASQNITFQSSGTDSAAGVYDTPSITPSSPIPEVEKVINNNAVVNASGLENGQGNKNSSPSKEHQPSTHAQPLPDIQSIPLAKTTNSNDEPKNTQDKKASAEETLQTEFEINPMEISEHERSGNAEWFMGRGSKSPERYMRIRNHIIDCWKKTRPNYLSKTAGRKSLSDCGDVNAVGRIHTYLESIHAINVNCKSPVKRSYARSSNSSEGSNNKKKAKKTPGYFWADVDEEEECKGHEKSNIIKGDGVTRPKRTAKKPETFYSENNESGHSQDPFTLVPVSFYSSEKNAPFTVNITSEALLVMDFHSHLAYTEVIGLLGGRIVQNGKGSQELLVEQVFPCRSTSTGIQCEMDPVSEMAARELFEQKGLSVVGWYHSHPTFEPEPSIRDIENQASYQDLFRNDVSGLEPFIGVIITPYNPRNIASEKSQIRFIHISKNWSPKNNYRLPFACFHKVTPSKEISKEVVCTLQNLILEYKHYEHKIDMSLQYGQVLRLDKLVRSIKCHLFMDDKRTEEFLYDIRSAFQNNDDKINNNSSQEPQQKQLDDVVKSLAV